MKTRLLLIAQILLIALIVCTLLFTFYQSSLPPEESAEVSDGVSEKLEPIIPSTTPTGKFVHLNIRKIAHFVEFATLGSEVALYVAFFIGRGKGIGRGKLCVMGLSYLFALVVALLDETVQVFTDRGPSITDVWLDFLGFFSLSTIVYLIFIVGTLVLRRKADRISNSAQIGD